MPGECIAITKDGATYEREPKLTAGHVPEARRRMSAGVSKDRVAKRSRCVEDDAHGMLAGEGVYGR